jgi:hypothetical protein
LAGAVLFVVLVALLHALKPDYDPSWRMVSEYAIGEHGWMMILAFLGLAASCAGCWAAVRSHVVTRTGRIGLALLLAVGAALAAAGIFVSDPITATRDQLTMHGNLHGLAATVGIPGFPIAALLVTYGLMGHRDWATAGAAIRWAAHPPWLSLLLMIATIALTLPQAGGRFGPSVPAGWPNRILVLSYAVWLIVVSRHALRLSGSTASRRRRA